MLSIMSVSYHIYSATTQMIAQKDYVLAIFELLVLMDFNLLIND